MSTTVDIESAAKRFVKSLRNVVHDPLPRNRTLSLSSIAVREAQVDFVYGARGQDYTISMMLPEGLAGPLREAAGPALDQLLTATGIAFSAFLFKLSDFAALEVRTAPLDAQSRAFFEDFLVGGLGEFRYLQGLDPARRIRVLAQDGPEVAPLAFETENRLLMLNGGGKDTIVAAELLGAAGQPFSWLTVRPNATRRKVVELSGVSDALEVGYRLDPRIDEDKAYPWAHVPHTSIVLAIGLLVAVLVKARYVAAGNELSSDSGNLVHRGVEVNHQYTKSSAFEHGFASFARRRVTDSVEVFSLLRPFHDLQLAELFAAQKRYLGHFISCNRGIHHGRWCKQCPKCAFTALALRPFASAQDLHEVFGEDVFARPAIRRHVLDLVSGAIKPWECVGTREECALALWLVLKAEPSLEFGAPPYRRELERALRGFDGESARERILDATGRRHRIPAELVAPLNRALERMVGARLRIAPSGHHEPLATA